MGRVAIVGLEIDHVFCFVDAGGQWGEPLQEAGWVLDEGVEHQGQGTRNRRLWLDEQYLELIWLSSRAQAAGNPVRLDRRADWRTTGACPFGFGLRGPLEGDLRAEFWEYRPPYARSARIWIHRTNELDPAAPLVFVLERPPQVTDGSAPRARSADRPSAGAHAHPASIHAVRLRTPRTVPALLASVTPPVTWRAGPPHVAVVVSDAVGPVLDVTEQLSLVG